MKPFWELGLNPITMKKEPYFDYVEFRERMKQAKRNKNGKKRN